MTVTAVGQGDEPMKYHDPNNFYPHGVLNWDGPGYYAGVGQGDTFTMQKIESADYEGEWPKAGEGFGTVIYAETPEEAAGSYARHRVE